MLSKDERIARELATFEPNPPAAAAHPISPTSAAADAADIFTAAVLLVMPRKLFRELERQAAQSGRHIAELARTACKLADSEIDGLNAWAHSKVEGHTHRFLIRMHRHDADRLRRQAARVGAKRAALMRAAIDAHLRIQPSLPTE